MGSDWTSLRLRADQEMTSRLCIRYTRYSCILREYRVPGTVLFAVRGM